MTDGSAHIPTDITSPEPAGDPATRFAEVLGLGVTGIESALERLGIRPGSLGFDPGPDHATDGDVAAARVEPRAFLVEDVPVGELQVAAGRVGRGRPAQLLVATLVVSDLIAGFAALLGGLALLSLISHAGANSLLLLHANFVLDTPFPFAMIAAFASYGLYTRTRRRLRPSGFSELKDIVHAVAMGGFLAMGVGVLLHRFGSRPEIAPSQLASAALVALVAVPALRALTWPIARWSGLVGARVLVVGGGAIAEQLGKRLSEDRGTKLIGYVEDAPRAGIRVLGSSDDLVRLCDQHRVDRVLVAHGPSPSLMAALRQLQPTVAISVVPRFWQLLSWRSHIEDFFGIPVVDVAPPSLSVGSRFVKRTFDIVVSSLCLLVSAPLLIGFAVAIKLTSPGPVLFSQIRTGQRGRPFRIYKLRSMAVDAEKRHGRLAHRNEADGPLFKIHVDPRVTKVGWFLRRTSLDELPQLLNVFLGQMSLVGPRPFVTSESEQIQGWAARRFEVRPGMTGLWQVSGRSNLSFDELRQLDYVYVASWSLWWDLRILWQTPACIFGGRGAY